MVYGITEKRGKKYYIKFKRSQNGEAEEKLLSLGTNWKEVSQKLKRDLEKLEALGEIDPYSPDFSDRSKVIFG